MSPISWGDLAPDDILNPTSAQRPITKALNPHQAVTPIAMTSTATLEKIRRLRQVGIFMATPEEVLLQLAEAVEEVHLSPGEQLFAKGDLGTSMYVLVAGCVRVHIGDQTVVELTDGEIVGELAALDPEPRSASVSAVDSAMLYRIEQSTLQALMADHPEIVQAVIRELAQRLRDTTAPYGLS
ncbi:cyclic nucleotide-binding domain-containing protein [Synechococcus sp. BSF8S]|uniref:cyclic nucleotide-binding domain-containing protein n=1 Tax=Synechococcales TaxID=1890424 RepID=UPI00351C72FC